MSKLKIKLEECKQIILVIITIIQIIIMFYYFRIENKAQDIEEINYNMTSKLTFNEISNDLNIDKNIEILEIEDLGENGMLK